MTLQSSGSELPFLLKVLCLYELDVDRCNCRSLPTPFPPLACIRCPKRGEKCNVTWCDMAASICGGDSSSLLPGFLETSILFFLSLLGLWYCKIGWRETLTRFLHPPFTSSLMMVMDKQHSWMGIQCVLHPSLFLLSAPEKLIFR